jgi:Uma2 family endonuclease
LDDGWGTRGHSLIGADLIAALRPRLRGGPCALQGSNLEVVARAAGAVTYPDLFVRCSPLETTATACETPVVVFEVLSTSTAQDDLSRKKYAYQSIPSVRAIIFVSQREAWGDIVRRTEHGWADGYVEGIDAMLELPEIGVAVPLAEIYEDVTFEPVPVED